MSRKKLIHIHSSEVINDQPKSPDTSVLERGEIAINYSAGNERIYVKNVKKDGNAETEGISVFIPEYEMHRRFNTGTFPADATERMVKLESTITSNEEIVKASFVEFDKKIGDI